MKDPAFLFYPGDWLGGTMGMTFEEKGAYMELLMLQFNRDKFTEAQAKHILNGSFDTTWIVLKDKFVSDGTFYWNERLRMEKEKRAKHCENQRDNINKRWKKEKNGKYDGNTAVLPLENENENENINVIKEKKESERKEKKKLNISFEDFWNLYDKKRGDLRKLEVKWVSLSNKDRQDIMDYIPKYKLHQPDKAFRKDPQTFLNNHSWNDELIPAGGSGVRAEKEPYVSEKYIIKSQNHGN